MIRWYDGEPDEVEPGMLLHFTDDQVFFVGSNGEYPSTPIRRYAIAVPAHWLEWAQSMASWRGHQ